MKYPPILTSVGPDLRVGGSLPSFPGFCRLEEGTLEELAHIRHARLFGKPACLAAAAVRRASDLINETDGRTGILCTGGPWNCEPSWNFASRAQQAGPAFVNPLQFPCTLVSATATIAASTIGAHGLSFVIGFDVFAFFEMMMRATQLLRHQFVDRVIAVGLSSRGDVITKAAFEAGLIEPPDVALAFVLGSGLNCPDLAVVEVSRDPHRLSDHTSAIKYEAILSKSNQLSFPINLPIISGEAAGATGAILVMAAVIHHGTLSESERSTEFVVTLRQGERFGMIVLKLLNLDRARFNCSTTDNTGLLDLG